MESITIADLQRLVESYAKRLGSEGILTPLHLNIGSKLYGRAYRLYFADGASAIGTSDGYLGMTKREAFETLSTIIHTIDDMHYLQAKDLD